MIKAGIVGAAGYTGGELIRLLIRHPEVEVVFAQSESSGGMRIDEVHMDLAGETNLCFVREASTGVDVLFLCGNHGDSRTFLSKHALDSQTKVIDLSADFRLIPHHTFENRHFAYGLTEWNKAHIQQANAVANPGCFATAILLACLPLVANERVSDFYITGITGSTGAGQSLSPTSHFSWRSGNIQAYKSLQHQHLGEISQTMQLYASHNPLPAVHFIPWRGDFTRGIFISAQCHTEMPLDDILKIYHDCYPSGGFVQLQNTPIFLKQVINTNKCLIQIEKNDNQLVIHAALDNLLKGASGQAVQNMNCMFGLPASTGLLLKPVGF